jgi:Zn-finger nucleic acid-binding protein
MTTLNCPRDGAELVVETYNGIQLDRCPECNGRWLDNGELAELEATVANEGDRLGTIDYARKESELFCIVCSRQMVAFNYRAYNLQLDTCEELHGYWLDAGEESRVRDVMEERVRGLARAASAEESWAKLLGGMRQQSFLNNIKKMFGGRP